MLVAALLLALCVSEARHRKALEAALTATQAEATATSELLAATQQLAELQAERIVRLKDEAEHFRLIEAEYDLVCLTLCLKERTS